MLLALMFMMPRGTPTPSAVHHGTVDDRHYRQHVVPLGAEAIALLMDDDDFELFLILSRQSLRQ